MSQWDPIPGETPIDLSGLIPKGVTSRAALNVAEARNIAKALVKYLAGRPSPRQAADDGNYTSLVDLHRRFSMDAPTV